MKKEYAQRLMAHLDASPTPFQSVIALKKMLLAAGAVELQERCPQQQSDDGNRPYL